METGKELLLGLIPPIATGLVVGHLAGCAGVRIPRMLAYLAAATAPWALFASLGLLRAPAPAPDPVAAFDRQLLGLPRAAYRIIGGDTVLVYHRSINGTGLGSDIVVTLTALPERTGP